MQKTVDRLDPRTCSDCDCDHLEFFALWNRDSPRGQRILAWRIYAWTTLPLATRAWGLFPSSATHRLAAFRRANLREISSSRFGQRRHLNGFPVANFS